MQAVNAEERQSRILALVRDQGRVEVTTVAVDLAVAPETIRRDLRVLAVKGLVRRIHGGAYPIESTRLETGLAERKTLHVEDNRRIAAAAVKLLGAAETVYVDEGDTPQLLATLLPVNRPLTVVTASVSTAAAIADSHQATVLLLGGRVRGRTLATVGSVACAMLEGFVIDLAFLGADGISPELGLTTSDPMVAHVKAKVLATSRRRVFIGHHSKFGASSLCRFAGVNDFEAIVTDTGLPSTEADRYSLVGPRVFRA